MLGEEFIQTGFAASLCAALVSSLGVIIAATRGDWALRSIGSISAFAVGMLSYAILFHLLLESLAASPLAIAWVLTGFAGMVIIGVVSQFAASKNVDGAAIFFGYASILALAVHSFVDGFIYAGVFNADLFTGWFSIAGLLFHELPEGIIVFSLVTLTGISMARTIAVSIAAASLTTIAGAAGAIYLLGKGVHPPEYILLAIVAGALIYVVMFHLMPHAAKAENKSGYYWAMAGVLVATLAHVANALGGGGHAH